MYSNQYPENENLRVSDGVRVGVRSGEVGGPQEVPASTSLKLSTQTAKSSRHCAYVCTMRSSCAACRVLSASSRHTSRDSSVTSL